MIDLIKHINIELENKFEDIKIPNAIFKKEANELHIKVLYKKDRELVTKEEIEELKQAVESFINEKSVKVVLTTKKALIDEDVVKVFVYRFLEHNYSATISTFSKNDVSAKIEGNNIKIVIGVDEGHLDFYRSKKIDLEIKSFFEKYFFENFDVLLKPVEKEDLNEFLNDRIAMIKDSLITEDAEKPVYVEVENVTEFLGDKVAENPLAPESVKTAESGIAVAGNIRFIVKKSYTSKQKNEQGGFINRDYFNFQIVGETGSVGCVLFLPQSEVEKFEELSEGEYVVAFGDTEMFNEKLSFRVRRVSLCTPKHTEIKQIEYKQENENYIFIKPEPYISLEQSNLFEEEVKVNDFLLNNDVVVFDFETTGLESSVNEIIEIGAVKIVKGKLTETFSALIKPKEEISEEITGITGITNEMVKDSLSIEQVLPDFYKFTKGTVLSAYNIAFDYNFLYAISKKMNYNFDNRQIDTMYLARTKLPGIKNYRLKTVATELGVTLDNAHRAVFDAVATAEIFIKLSDDLK